MDTPGKNSVLVRVTPSGMLLFWISLFAIPLGILLYSGPVLMLGVMGVLFLAATRWLAARQMDGLSLQRRIPKRGFPGEMFEIETRLSNQRSHLGSRELTLDDKLAGYSGAAIRFGEVPPGNMVSRTYPARVFQRGRLRVVPFSLSSTWPFGLFQSTLKGDFEPLPGCDDSVLIAPKPVLPSFVDGILQQIEQESALFSELVPDEPSEFRSLREFRSGDALKSIHWPATSRANSLIVREFDPPLPRPQRQGILLHQFAAPGEMNQPDRFEKILRITCGLLVRFWQREMPVVMRIELTGQRLVYHLPGRHNFHEVLDVLAEAQSHPAKSLEYLSEGWDIFENCDQVFVLGDCPRDLWQAETTGLHPVIVCLDPVSGEITKRKPRLIKTLRKA